MKYRGVLLALKSVLLAVIIAAMGGVIVSIGMTTIDSYRDATIRRIADGLDHALFLYGTQHKSIDPDSLHEVTDAEGNQQLKYNTRPLYPERITDLQSSIHLVSPMTKFAAAISASTPGVFKYTVTRDANGEITKYKLETYLYNGSLYKSPNSKGD